MLEIVCVLWYNKTLFLDHVALSPDQEITDYKSPCLCRAEIGKWNGSDCVWED